ncbi:MAG: HPr family phosphocarrier protein [Verrucomicrobiales bacterium]|nr:HPr family phosphocarrier protein [Verrucomicrobiales bacterium]MCP5526994.1 HPr family phosphocarrier protein [Verrucomicrobiales bacterium]
MKTHTTMVPWEAGLHVRPASVLARVARRFRSRVLLRAGGKAANAVSILSVMLLCAAQSTPLEIEVDGDDEEAALQAVLAVFAPEGVTEASPD